MTEPQPWERREGEPNRWFQRFESFRLMGPGRTLEAVWKAENSEGKRPGKSWYKWPKIFQWNERAAAWDKHLMDKAAAEIEARWKSEIMESFEVLGRLSQMGRVNIADFVDLGEDGRLLGIKEEALRERGHLVKKITTSEGKTNSIGIEMYDAQAALTLLGRYLKLFTEQVDHNHQVTEEQVVFYIPDNGRDSHD